MHYTDQRRTMVIGKHNGILHWFEDTLKALPKNTSNFAFNSFGLLGRIYKHVLGTESLHYQNATANALERSITKERPTHIIVVDRFYLSPDVNRVLANSNAHTAQWIGDRFDSRLKSHSGIQNFFFTDTGLLMAGEQMGLKSHYLPLATQPAQEALLPWEDRATELLFVGAPSAERIEILKKIRHSIRVIGPKWPHIDNPNVSLARHRLSLAEVRQLYASHRFVLNQINAGNLVCGLPARCFDATERGACLITDAVQDLPLNFNIDHEVLTYTSIETLNELLHSLKSHPEAAQRIAMAGQLRCNQQHHFQHRVRSLLQTLQSVPAQ